MKFSKLWIMLCMLTLLLFACSSKPDNVNQELWDRSIQYTLYADKLTKEGKQIPEGFASDLNEYAENKTEKEIVVDVSFLAMTSLLQSISSNDETKKGYDDAYKKLQETFGSDLKSNKLNTDLVESYISKNKENKEKQEQESLDKFKEETGVTLTGKEVQYNLSNNLDKEFYLDGTVKLCDYYNYGFTNESKFFCGQLTPVDGKYSDSWYLYFNRESFDSAYEALLNRNVNMRIVAKIPSKAYKRGQGNMAGVTQLQIY